MNHNEITAAIVDTAIAVHRKLGPGLLESVYRRVLAYELRIREFDVVEEFPVPVVWDDMRLEFGFRADLIVNSKVVDETKSKEKLVPVEKKQLLTYLRIIDMRVGLLINFGEVLLKNGIHRIVGQLQNDGEFASEQR